MRSDTMRTTSTVLAAAALAWLAGCTVKNAEPPPLSGPSTLATSIVVTALPDSILQDNSTSTIIATVTGPDGRPIANLPLRAEIFVDGIAQDFGTLTPRQLSTGSDGIARFVYTSPPRPLESVGTGTRVTVAITPLGSDFRAEVRRQVDINVVPPGVILPPNGAPVPAFVVTPSPANTRQVLTFDASATTDEGVPCGGRCSYAWTFGDGTSGAGLTTTHEYRTSGSFSVALTVTDQRNTSATTTQTLAVGATTPPTASFTISPTPAGVNQDVFFNAQASRPAQNRRIVNYGWNFGDGQTASGVTVTHRYSGAGTYTITLSVTDDSDAVQQNAQTLVVGAAGGPTAVLTFLPTAPKVGERVAFDANGSTPGTGATIVSYLFDYGDGSPSELSPVPNQSHTYGGPGQFVASVTVTDSLGRSVTKTVSVPVIP